MRVAIRRTPLPLRRPLATAHGEVAARDVVVLKLEAGDGLAGFGEAAPLPGYDAVSTEDAALALGAYAATLRGLDGTEPLGEVLAACRAVDDVPHALAAVDMAWWDL